MGLFGAQVVPAAPAARNPGERRTVTAAVAPAPPRGERDQNQFPLTAIGRVLDPAIVVSPSKLRGRVSIERLLVLQDYTQRTSTTRAIVVCLLTPVPALVVAVVIESLPLAPPSLGWHEQGMFWARLFLSGITMALVSSTAVGQATGRSMDIGVGQMIAYSVLASILFVGAIVGLAKVWTFPVPFLLVMSGAPLALGEFLAAFTVFNVRAIKAKLKGLQGRMEAIAYLTSNVFILYWIYPLHRVAYEYVGPKYQVALLLVLPIFKGHWKRRVCRKLAEVEDLIPTIMMFTIELFNSLYLTTCMQLSRSLLTSVAVILFDVLLGILRVRRVHRRTAELLAAVKAEKMKSGSSEWDLLHWFLDRIQDASATRLNAGLLATARVRSNGLEHNPTESSAALLQALDGVRQNRVRLLRRQHSHSTATASDDTALNQTLQFLFHCEFMVLTEYIECAIPLFYAIYLPILHSLPNAVYYGHVRALSTNGLRFAELSILVYWLFQLGSLVVIMLWLRHHFGLSVLRVLAFVLEEQVIYVQANMVLQMMIALPFTLAHYGTSLTIVLLVYCVDRKANSIFLHRE
jgi:hypothetical protein